MVGDLEIRGVFEISVVTMHQTFVEDLNSSGLEGIRAEYRPTMAYDTVEEHILEIVVTSVTSVGLKLVADWIVEYLKSKPPKETTINNQTIINNPENVVMIVNNYVTEAQSKEKD